MTPRPAVVLFSESALPLARRIKTLLPEAELLGFGGRIGEAESHFSDTAAALAALFREERPIIGLCAAGILIRALAPLLADKKGEPPVLALAEDGSAVLPLLGGHRGANALARELAEGLGSFAALTTAGELRVGLALDAPPAGWRLANPQDAKAVMAELLAGRAPRLEGEAPWLAALPQDPQSDKLLLVTERAEPGGPGKLVYHPASLALGVGCERGTAPEELRALAESCLAEAGVSPLSVALVASLDLKADEPAVALLAAALGVPARFFPAARLEEERRRLATPSETVFREVGCHGVAEGAALAAVGAEGRLLLAKRRSARATCAIARAPFPLDAQRIGRPRGALHVVGIGPGGAAWRTAEASALLARAEELVGYRLYLDLLGPLADGKGRHDFALGEEEARVCFALERAAEGREVALVSSGDAGIYAMASLVFELLERGGRPEWSRLAITVAPGVSALQAAAARVGAPLGHDFCSISLSDLLTPWPTIERRIEAAAAGDFVIAFYNPVSHRRAGQLARARDLLLKARPPGTPVVLARNLGRAGEGLEVVSLAELDPARVDMLTLVLVGSSTTRSLPRGDGGTWVYTPRGYGEKVS